MWLLLHIMLQTHAIFQHNVQAQYELQGAQNQNVEFFPNEVHQIHWCYGFAFMQSPIVLGGETHRPLNPDRSAHLFAFPLLLGRCSLEQNHDGKNMDL